MATLPENNINISNGVVFQNYPSLTFYADPVTHRITGKADGRTPDMWLQNCKDV